MSDISRAVKTGKHFYSDISFWSLVIANIITITWALMEDWSLASMFWVHFFQNIILGLFWPAKVFASPVDNLYAKKVRSIIVFVPHYFFIHFSYASALYSIAGEKVVADFKNALVMAGFFLFSETISYLYEDSSPRAKPLSLVTVHLFPYARVLPMHFIMVCGLIYETKRTSSALIVPGFLLMKALADVAMYMVERNRVLGNFVTDMFGRDATGLFGDFFPLEQNPTIFQDKKQLLCKFCGRVIAKNEAGWVIGESVVCVQCYKRIQKLKAKTS